MDSRRTDAPLLPASPVLAAWANHVNVVPVRRIRQKAHPRILASSRTIQLYDVMLDAVRCDRSSRLPNPSTQPCGNRAQPRVRA